SASEPRLRGAIERALHDNGLVGAVWSQITPNGAIEVDAAGLKDARTGTRLSAEDRVHVGSIAKVLLATGVLRLVSENRLDLEAPVTHLLPRLKFENPWETSDPIRVRHLLDHTSGLDDARLWQVFSMRPQADTPLAAAFPGAAGLLRVRSRPGSRFSYSNMGYGLLGMLIESGTGERYERYLNEHLLTALAMRQSTFLFTSQVGPGADPRLAMGHFEDRAPHAAVPAYLRPATQFTTTAKDMALLSRFLMSDGRIDGKPFISPALLQQMGRPHGTEAERAGLPAGYGLGLARRDRHGTIGKCHEGNTVGFLAMLCLFPQQQKAFFIALNADSETADYEQFNALLIDALGVSAEQAQASAAPAHDIAEWDGIYVPAPNRFATFAWLDTVFSFVSVSWSGTHLQLGQLQSADKVLAPHGGLLFRASDRATASHVLLKSADGSRILSNGFQTFERISTAKIGALWTSLGAGVLGLIYILFSGLARLMTRRLSASQPVFAPFMVVIALLLSLPLFFGQSFLQLGDLTVASATLAAATALLPLAMLVCLGQQIRRPARGTLATLDVAAALAVLQLTLILAAWGLVPLRLWN
ncbi:MAG TPA: serine hydrolase domain-containing protein, partial [Steroidobacteraceae bacterium]|nr:serine hydrolase domain-containing protein [Steroidobacteraceae bacterium]